MPKPGLNIRLLVYNNRTETGVYATVTYNDRRMKDFLDLMKLFFGKVTERTIPALLAASVAILIWTGSAFAQDASEQGAGAQSLELFEDVERTNSNANLRAGRNSGGNSAAPSLTEPEFLLIGASRIGDRRRVVLSHRSGETVTVPMPADGRASIPGHEQFRIVTNEAGRVAIQYPVGSSCVESADRGVSCDAAANIAWLSLRPAPAPEQFVVDLNENIDEESDADAQVRDAAEDLARDPNNPFARLRAEALGQDVPPAGRFRPRRIDPSQVPPGMRVVSTPFGDRLVEID